MSIDLHPISSEQPMTTPSSKNGHVPVRIAVVCDLLQENWPSMDLVGDTLWEGLTTGYGSGLDVKRLRPSYARHFVHFARGPFKTVDAIERGLNRFVKYPRWLSQRRESFDLFHVVDHSY